LKIHSEKGGTSAKNPKRSKKKETCGKKRGHVLSRGRPGVMGPEVRVNSAHGRYPHGGKGGKGGGKTTPAELLQQKLKGN